MAASNTFPISFPGKSSPACPASPFPPGGRLPPNGDSRTPTLMRASGGRSPLYQQHHSGGRNAGVASTGHVNGNGLLLQVPHMLGYHNHRASSPSSPRNSIHDRLIPCRAQTDMQLAQHLLSPLSAPSSLKGSNSKETSAQQMIDEDASPNHRSSVNRILQFGRNPIQGRTTLQNSRPLSLVTHSSAGGMSSRQGKVKIPTKPDRVMAAPGTFLECGSQSAQWAPSSNLVVALESGVYVCRINEDCNVVEIGNNGLEPENPFCHVIWNADGNAVICGKMSGEVKICDIRQSQTVPRRIEWGLHLKQTLRSIALEQEHLLTCGGLGIKIYDLRQIGGAQQLQEPMISLKSRSSTVNSVSWSPNGHLLAGGCENGMTYLWDVRHPAKEMITLKQQQNNSVQVVNWCNWKSSILLTGSSFPRPTVCVHNTATGVLLNQVDCASEVTGIQFNAQLKQVATSHHSVVSDSTGAPIEIGTTQGAESSVQLWQLSSHKLCPLMQLGQHEEGIVAMSSSVNGHQLLTMGGDELLCLWHWSETVHQSASKAGPLTVRSLLNPANLIR